MNYYACVLQYMLFIVAAQYPNRGDYHYRPSLVISRFSGTILPKQGDYRAQYVNRFRDLLRAVQLRYA